MPVHSPHDDGRVVTAGRVDDVMRSPLDLEEALMRIDRLFKVQTIGALKLDSAEWPAEGKDPLDRTHDRV